MLTHLCIVIIIKHLKYYTMAAFNIPTKSEVSEKNQQIFNDLEKGLGFVPNLYAYYAKNETALGDYLQLQERKTTLNKKEKEIVNLVVSQYNDCYYCQSAHTVIAGLNGFSKDQILEIRNGSASFAPQLNALAKFTLSIVSSKGKVSEESKNAFFEAGYTEQNLIDVVMNIGDKTISNFIHNIAGFKVDFPAVPSLEQ